MVSTNIIFNSNNVTYDGNYIIFNGNNWVDVIFTQKKCGYCRMTQNNNKMLIKDNSMNQGLLHQYNHNIPF